MLHAEDAMYLYDVADDVLGEHDVKMYVAELLVVVIEVDLQTSVDTLQVLHWHQHTLTHTANI